MSASASQTSATDPKFKADEPACFGMAVVWAIAIATLLLHVYFNNRYG